MDLQITIKEIKGKCPVYKVGDQFIIKDGYRLETEIPLCMHALSSVLPVYNTLRFVNPKSIGINGKEEKDKAYVQCLDPVNYTGGGTVVFEILRT